MSVSFNTKFLEDLKSLQPETWSDVLKDIVDTFVTHTAKSIEQLKNNIECKNFINASKIAHSLKSSTRALGAEKLGDICDKLEIDMAKNDIDSLQIEKEFKDFEAEYDLFCKLLLKYSEDSVK